MTRGAIGSSIKEQLADPEGSIWLTIAGDVLPRVRRELHGARDRPPLAELG